MRLRASTQVLPVLALSLLVAMQAGSAHAQRTSSLSWVRLAGAEDCISTQALAERVEQRIGREAFVSASQADLSLEGRVERSHDPDRVVATLVMSDRAGRVLGQRLLKVAGSDCGLLEPSLVLVIAIAIDPNAAIPKQDRGPGLSPQAQALLSQLGLPQLTDEQLLAELAVPDPNAPPPETVAQARPASPTHKRVRDDERDTHAASTVRIALSLGLSGELGVLPDPGLGAELRVGIESLWPVWLELSFAGLFEQEHTLQGEQVHSDYGLLAAGLAACWPFNPLDVWSVRACGGARAGMLFARGSGLADELSAPGPWVELLAGLGLRVRFDREGALFAQALVGAGAPLIRDRFGYQDRLTRFAVLHRSSAITGRAELGFGARF